MLESHIEEFFCELVEGNWPRIQKLTLSHDSELEFSLRMLSFPAPQLDEFKAPYRWDADEEDDPMEPLFSDYAPLLRSIDVSRPYINQQSSWLSHLHSMTLDDTYCLSDVLGVLSATRNLQELRIIDITHGYTDTTHPIVSLHHLQNLEYFSNCCNAGIAFLNNIAIRPSCSLTVHVNSFFDHRTLRYEKPFVVSAIDKFILHAKSALRSYMFDIVELGHEQKERICLNAFGPEKRQLTISIPLNGDSDASLLETLLSKLLALDFTLTTKLKFTAHSRLHSCFGPLLSRLISVNTVSIDLQTLSNLSVLQNTITRTAIIQPGIIFPLLTVMELLFHPVAPRNVAFINQVAGAFILSRSRAGVPLTTFDMSPYPPLDTAPNLQALGDVKDLTVRYRLSEVEGVIEYTYGAKTEKKH